MGNLPFKERVAWAVREGAKIHPQYPTEFECGFSVAWHKTPYTLGGWAEFSGETNRDVLNRPDGRVYLAGDHMTYLIGWMAGALESARYVSTAIHTRAQQESKRAA
jgi:monoamine oxidase